MPKLSLVLQHSLVVLGCIFAHVATATPTCRLAGTLFGDSRYFWLWGRDAWSGEGLISCEGKPGQRVRITLSSWESGSGVSRDNVIEMKLDPFSVEQANSLFATYRTYREDTVNVDFSSTTKIHASAGSLDWTFNLRSIGKSIIDFKKSINFGQLSIEAIPEGNP